MAIDSIIIGFGYRARSGKDTAVAEIIKQRGLRRRVDFPYVEGEPFSGVVGNYDIRKYAFADSLRRETEYAARRAGSFFNLLVKNRPTHFMQANENFIELPDWVVFDPNGEVNEQYPLSKQRTFLQWWGSEYRRSIDTDYWVRQLAQTIELDKPEIALITDMRFPNEMDFVKQYGETVLVDRPGLPPATHISETALAHVSLEDWSIVLENSGSLEEFLLGAVTCFDELMVNFP